MAVIDNSPRMNPNHGSVGAETPKSRTPDEQKASELKGLLNFITPAANFKHDVTPYVEKGSAADTPRQDGAVRNRSEGVKTFFKGIGEGLGGFLSKIGNAFSTAFSAIKEAVAARIGGPTVAQATTPKPQLDAQSTTLKDFIQEFGKSLEASYQNYLGETDDTPSKSREDFVKERIPDPPGDIDTKSIAYIGDRLDDVSPNLDNFETPGDEAMTRAVMDRFAEVPTLDTASIALLAEEVTKTFSGGVQTFVRNDCAYSKLDRFEFRNAIPIADVSRTIFKGVGADIRANSGIANGGLAVVSMNKNQADVMFGIVDKMLDALLSTEHDEPGSYMNQIPDSYRSFLSDKVDLIANNNDIKPEDKGSFVKVLFANSLFLRGVSGELAVNGPRAFLDPNEKTVALMAAKIAQTFFNGNATFPSGKGSDEANTMLGDLFAKHQPRLTDFLVGMGMPANIAATANDEKDTIE